MDAPDIDAALARSLVEPSASLADVRAWLDSIEAAERFEVAPRGLGDLDRWTVDPGTGDISHASGRFFSVRGATATISREDREWTWQQPIIVQPDIGVLGLVAARVDGVLRFLVQAKMEPGNRRLVQVSPTVQATASNFQRIHQGSATEYLEYFLRPGEQPGYLATLVDQLQSEQSSRYLRKRNRNSVILVDARAVAPSGERFRWLTLADLIALAGGDDLLHMDTRSILGSLPFSPEAAGRPAGARWQDREAHGWLADMTMATSVSTTLMPLGELEGWRLRDGVLAPPGGTPFSIVGVRVTATAREVSSWDQPLVGNAAGTGSTLVVQRTEGSLRVLLSAATGLGVRDSIELGPTLRDWPAGEMEAALDTPGDELLQAAAEATVRFDNDLPEEGGRFFHSSARHRIVELAADAAPLSLGPRRWFDLTQIRDMAAHTSLCNMELRSILACLPVDLRLPR